MYCVETYQQTTVTLYRLTPSHWILTRVVSVLILLEASCTGVVFLVFMQHCLEFQPRNGNIRKFLAQKAAYVNHGTEKNEEINLFGIDGSKPGAASAGVWLSHKVIGLHCDGYGLLLRQSTFSAGIMYSMWVSMGR